MCDLVLTSLFCYHWFPSYGEGPKSLPNTVVRELRVHELSQTDLVTLYQLHLLVWENYYIVYVHLIFLRGILLYKIHYKICLSFRATCKVLLKHGIEKKEECSVNFKTYSAKSISYLVIFQN